MRFRKKFIIIFLIGILIAGMIGFGIGFSYGAKQTIIWSINLASYLIKQNALNVTIDERILADGIYRYQNNIGGCWNITANRI